jgi:hypothetical protein
MSTDNQTDKKSKLLDPKANLKVLFRVIVIVVVIIGGIWLFVRFTAGEKAANRVTETLLQRPMELKNSIESVTASSWKGFPIALPYTGTLTVEMTVVKGNEVNVYVVAPDQIEKIKEKRPFTHLLNFEANKTKNYRRSDRLSKGDYYLVVIDPTLGILSASASDIKIQARLEP